MEKVSITINNWDKYQDRKDVQHPKWFRLENRLPSSEGLFGLTSSERWVWVSLMCLASQRNSGDLEFLTPWFCQQMGCTEAELESAIVKLETNGCLVTRGKVRAKPGRNSRTRANLSHDITRQDITDITNITVHDSVSDGPAPAGGKTRAFIQAYCEAYKAKYGVNPPINGKAAGIAARTVKDFGLEKSCDLVRAYLQMSDPRWDKECHPLGLFTLSITRVGTALAKGVEDPGAPDYVKILREHDAAKGVAGDTRKLPSAS